MIAKGKEGLDVLNFKRKALVVLISVPFIGDGYGSVSP